MQLDKQEKTRKRGKGRRKKDVKVCMAVRGMGTSLDKLRTNKQKNTRKRGGDGRGGGEERRGGEIRGCESMHGCAGDGNVSR